MPKCIGDLSWNGDWVRHVDPVHSIASHSAISIPFKMISQSSQQQASNLVI